AAPGLRPRPGRAGRGPRGDGPVRRPFGRPRGDVPGERPGCERERSRRARRPPCRRARAGEGWRGARPRPRRGRGLPAAPGREPRSRRGGEGRGGGVGPARHRHRRAGGGLGGLPGARRRRPAAAGPLPPALPAMMSLRRAVQAVLHVEDTPHRIALAFAVGVFIAFFPIWGIHTAMALGVAFLFRLSRAATMVGAWVNNPWTMA